MIKVAHTCSCKIRHPWFCNNSLNIMECGNIANLSKSWIMPMPDMYSFKSVHQIAVDWASHNWYFLDDTLEIILLCALKSDFHFFSSETNDKFLCKMILSAHLSKPRGIALDPNEGFMFFTIWGSEQAKLERASLGK